MRKNGSSMQRAAWQIYAALFCGVQFFGILQTELISEKIALSAWSLLGCVPLLGFAFGFKAAIPLVWKAYFLLLVLAAVVFSAFLFLGAINSGLNKAHAQSLLAMIVQVPFWYAVWAYAYRSKDIWARSA